MEEEKRSRKKKHINLDSDSERAGTERFQGRGRGGFHRQIVPVDDCARKNEVSR